MAGFADINKSFGFFEKYLLGYALGTAAGPSLSPFVQDLANNAWQLNQHAPPDVYALAQGVAQGQIDPKQAATWATWTGYHADIFNALVDIANTGPPLGPAMDLLRRGVWTPAQYKTALHRMGIETQWFDGLLQLQTRLLDPADLARGIHKSLIPDPGLLAVGQPVGVGKVPAYPVYNIDALAMAAGSGYTKDELGVLVGLQGNPMGAHEAAQALFRGTIEKIDFDRAIAEGNTRNEWGDAILEQSRAIPSPTNYVEGFVRNWISKDAMNAGAGRHGMTPEDVDLLFKIHGNPLTHNQVFIALQRGGTYDGPTGDIDPAFLKSLQESNMRPEWYNLCWHARYHFPPFFQTIQLLNKGLIDAQTARNWLTWQAYDPDAIETVIASATGAKPAATPGPVKSATTSAITAIRKGYIGGAVSKTDAEAHLTTLGESATDQAALFKVWDVQRAVEATAPPAAG